MVFFLSLRSHKFLVTATFRTLGPQIVGKVRKYDYQEAKMLMVKQIQCSFYCHRNWEFDVPTTLPRNRSGGFSNLNGVRSPLTKARCSGIIPLSESSAESRTSDRLIPVVAQIIGLY